jgi:ceramide glucosyltransferase
MLTFNALLVGAALVFGMIPLLLTARFKAALRHTHARSPMSRVLPPASLILPCKGLDPGFEDNIRSLLEQDYPGLERLFVVASEDDPAYGALQSALQQAAAWPHPPQARLLVAGFGSTRAQKLTNQLAAIRQASPSSQVFVFVDSDCRPDRTLIRRLVEPLGSPAVGASTGYRWYHPPAPTLGSMLRSTWNAGALPFLIDPKRVHCWGGMMAIRRDVFEQAGIAQAWDRAVSDDMTLTVGVRRLGLEVRFVPECIAVSYESSTVSETLEFTNRQSLISRIYFPPLWWGTAIGHALANVLMFYGAGCFVAGLLTGSPAVMLGAACALLLPLQLANAAWLFGSARDLLPEGLRAELSRLRWHYVFTAPLASIMSLVNTVHAASTRRMTWRGIEYELRSPTETVVLNRGREASA